MNATLKTYRSNLRKIFFVKMTKVSHNRQCNDIEKANTDFLKYNLKMTYGINRRSKLTEYPHFDIINQIPLDIMHVILEGVAPYETNMF